MDAIGRYGLALFLGLVATAVGAGGTERGAPVAASSRGELLYENHCKVCHESVVHVRENRKVKSREDLRGWVARWSSERKLNWSNDEINDVADFLARRFYKFGKREKG